MISLIKNINKQPSSKPACLTCEDRGYITVVDLEEFDRVYDRYDDMAIFTGEQCRMKALAESKIGDYYCPFCEKGHKFINKYPRYQGNKKE